MSKKKLLLVGLFFLLVNVFSFSSDLFITVSVDWSLGIRGGVEYRFNRYSGIRGDIGVSMIQVPAASLFYVVYLKPEDNKLSLNLLFGVPRFMLPFDINPFRPYPMISFGGSFLAGYNFNKIISADIRLGGGFPLFFGEDKPIVRPFFWVPISDTQELPVYFFPDLTASVTFKLK